MEKLQPKIVGLVTEVKARGPIDHFNSTAHWHIRSKDRVSSMYILSIGVAMGFLAYIPSLLFYKLRQQSCYFRSYVQGGCRLEPAYTASLNLSTISLLRHNPSTSTWRLSHRNFTRPRQTLQLVQSVQRSFQM
jgi:hypothetical protein